MESADGDWEPVSLGRERIGEFDAMRERAAVCPSSKIGWTVLRHEDVLALARDHERLSNVRLNRGEEAPVAARNIPLEYDPPEHSVYRKLLQPLFSPAGLRTLEPRMRALAAQDLPALITGAPIAVVENFADPFPVRVLCDFLGWHHEDWRLIKHMSEQQRISMTERDPEKMAAAHAAWRDYIMPVVEKRRTEPAEDVSSWLLTQSIDGRPLSEREIISILRALLVAGHGTTSASTGILIAYLASHPAEQRMLRTNPEKISRAIEEILRCHGPLAGMQRTATQDMEICGRSIRKGDRVALMFTAANRDPRAFEDADQVKLDRPAAPHLLFGAGIHVCQGASFARMQLRIVLSELLARTRSISLAGAAPGTRATAWPTNDLEEFEIICEPAA